MRFFYLPVHVLGLETLWKKGFKLLYLEVDQLWSKSGVKFTSQYLSECSRALICWAGNEEYVQGKTWISLTASGLPKILPIYLRKQITTFKRGSESGKLVLRVTLTVLSVYRIMGFAPIFKWETITGPFTGTTQILPEWELKRVIKHIRKIDHLKKPDLTDISESAGPNYPRATWSSAKDAIALAMHPKQALAFVKWCLHYEWHLPLLWWLWILIVAMVVYPSIKMCAWVSKAFCSRSFRNFVPYFGDKLKIGKLSTVMEARGKVRIVAIVDYWSQMILKPLHASIFRSLRLIDQDGTFDQVSPMMKLLDRARLSNSRIASFDLSAATDRLPIELQVQILNLMGVRGDLWRSLLQRPYIYVSKDEDENFDSQVYEYAVGQPMGAYSSWGMLALTHHIIVQIAANRAGFQSWFRDYGIIGDDIIIANDLVAESYRALMNELGVEINMTKSHYGNVAEFAKRWCHVTLGEITPIGAGNILTVVRNIRLLPNLVMDSSMKGYPNIWNIVHRAAGQLPSTPGGVMGALAVLMFCLGPSGIVRSGTQSPAEWLGRWASLYYGNTVLLPYLLSVVLYAERLVRNEEIDRENSRHREEQSRFHELWTLYPQSAFVKTGRWYIRVSPEAPTLGWLLGLDTSSYQDGGFRNPLALWKIPWPIQINFNKLFWAVLQRVSPGYFAYSQEVPDLLKVPPSGTVEQLRARRHFKRKFWFGFESDLREALSTIAMWQDLTYDSNEQLKRVGDINWNREILSADYVDRTLAIYGKVMEILYPPTPDQDTSLSLTIHKPPSAMDELHRAIVKDRFEDVSAVDSQLKLLYRLRNQ